MYVCMYVCMYVHTYVRTYVRMYICMLIAYKQCYNSSLHVLFYVFQSLGMIEEIESTGGSGLTSQPPTKQERPKTNRSKTARKR